MKTAEFLHHIGKLDRIPKFSIILTFIFLLGFISLNILVYVENNRRLQLIEDLNRDNLPVLLTEAQTNITLLDKIIDSYDFLPVEEWQKFSSHVHFLAEKIEVLQSGPLAIQAATALSNDFSALNEELHNLKTLSRDLADLKKPEVREKVNISLQNINKAFLHIELQAQHIFQERVGGTVEALRDEQQTLLVLGLIFVVLGAGLMVFLALDLFRRSDMLDKAHEAERMKSSFFAMMSHEIRTPINGILGTLRLLQDSKLDAAQKQLTQTAHHSAEGLLVIVNDVLDYSKIEAGKFQLEFADFKLRPMIEAVFELIRPLGDAKGLKLSYTIADDIPDNLHADHLRVRQILLNFISNAIKFTDTGFVHLDIRKERVEQSTLTLTHLRFDVTDSGMGISPEVKQRLFREFSQADGSYARRFEGTGLGLAICRRLVEMMKGYVGVISELGKGSTFWFSFPLKIAQGAILDETKGSVDMGGKRALSILLAEDNQTNQMIAVAFLKKGGHEVSVAENGIEAVELAKKGGFDMILMDISMPEMDGFVAAKHIRSLQGIDRNIPIIAMTAHAMRGDREACLNAGMNDYITKPINREDLLAMVAKWAPKTEQKLAPDHGGFYLPETKKAAPVEEKPSAQKTVPEALPELSEAHFKQIMDDLGRENIAHFASLFLDDLKATGQEMLDAAHHENWDKVKTLAHSLKSSTLSFGLIALSSLAKNIEMQCKEKGRAETAALEAWPNATENALKALNERMAREGLS